MKNVLNGLKMIGLCVVLALVPNFIFLVVIKMKNVKVSKIFRFEEDDVNSFEKKYGKGLLTIFFRNCLEKAVDKNGFDFVQSVIFSNDISADRNYIN